MAGSLHHMDVGATTVQLSQRREVALSCAYDNNSTYDFGSYVRLFLLLGLLGTSSIWSFIARITGTGLTRYAIASYTVVDL